MAAAASAACAPSGLRPQPDAPTAPTTQGSWGPILPTALVRGYDRAEALNGASGPAVGTPAVDFVLNDIQGHSVSLSGLLAEKPVMMILGSYTCPV